MIGTDNGHAMRSREVEDREAGRQGTCARLRVAALSRRSHAIQAHWLLSLSIVAAFTACGGHSGRSKQDAADDASVLGRDGADAGGQASLDGSLDVSGRQDTTDARGRDGSGDVAVSGDGGAVAVDGARDKISVIQPSLCINFIICCQGLYPPRD